MFLISYSSLKQYRELQKSPPFPFAPFCPAASESLTPMHLHTSSKTFPCGGVFLYSLLPAMNTTEKNIIIQMGIHMAELQSCTGFWEGSPTPVFNKNALFLGHPEILIEITSIYGFHKGVYNLRYCFILVFSLKAQRMSE